MEPAAGEKLLEQATHDAELHPCRCLATTMEPTQGGDGNHHRVENHLWSKQQHTATEHLLAARAGQEQSRRMHATPTFLSSSLPQPARKARTAQRCHSRRRTRSSLLRHCRPASPRPASTIEVWMQRGGAVSFRPSRIRSRTPPPPGKKPRTYRRKTSELNLNLYYDCRTSPSPLSAGITGERASVRPAPAGALLLTVSRREMQEGRM
jgi:hypothetical protein